jgi:hypothetical protein
MALTAPAFAAVDIPARVCAYDWGAVEQQLDGS